jgi:hypothetical protein
VKKIAFCFSLLFALPMFASISQKQAPVATWNTGSQTSCTATLGPTTAGDLIVVWTYWKTSGTNNITVNRVTDSYGNGTGSPTPVYPSAVGPTLQPASNTAAQVFYASNTLSGSGNDAVLVTFSGSVGVASGCVAVEYQGADTMNPLDSVSQAISYGGSPSGTLDSGTVAPANANLLVFGGGNIDNSAAPNPGSLFANVESNSSTNNSSITEQYIPSSPNNVLQRATANYTTLTPMGNWVMQMAVFRAAAWTVASGWSPARTPQVINAAQYPGSDPCVQAQNAEAGNQGTSFDMPIVGGGEASETVCSVSPLSGLTGSGVVTVTNIGEGNNTVLEINSPIVFLPGQTLQALPQHAGDSSGVMIAASSTFMTNYSSPRTFTNTGGTPPFTITNEGSTPGCYRLTYAASAVNYLYVIRGTEPDIQFSGFANPLWNGNFRAIAGNGAEMSGDTWGDPFCVQTGKSHAEGPNTTSFAFFNAAAAEAGLTGCTGSGSSACGSTAQIQGITYLVYLGPSPTTTVPGDGMGGTCGAGTGSGGADDQYCAITLLGQAGSGTPVAAGAVLKNIGLLANGYAGVGGVASIYGQEGSGWINDSTAIARVPGPTGAVWSAGYNAKFSSQGSSSQNFYTFQGVEDYCNDNKTGQLCYSASEGGKYTFTGISVNGSGMYYGGTISGGANNAFAGYYFTTSGFMNGANNQICLVGSSTATSFTVLPDGNPTHPCTIGTTMEMNDGTAVGVLGMHVGFICNDDWSRTCIDNLTANYAALYSEGGNKSPAIWINGISKPPNSSAGSGSAGPVLVGRIHGQSFQELALIGDQEPTKDVSIASLQGNATGFKYGAIISCNFNGGATCPATNLTTPSGPGNTTSDIAISNVNGGPNAEIWDQFENPTPGPLADCPLNNNTTPGCWTDSAILDWKMHNCTYGDGGCNGTGLSITSTSTQFPRGMPSGSNACTLTGMNLYGNATNTGFVENTANSVLYCSAGSAVLNLGNSLVRVNDATPYQFSNSSSASGAVDTGVSRDAPAVLDVGNGTQGDRSAFLRSGNTVRVASNFTTAANTNLQTIAGLSWTFPATGTMVFSFTCDLTYQQATGNAVVAFGIQAATNPPTNIFATGTQEITATSPATYVSGSLPTLTTTMPTNIVSGMPGATTVNYTVHLGGTIENPASTANAINIMVSTATAGDAVTVLRGSQCAFTP